MSFLDFAWLALWCVWSKEARAGFSTGVEVLFQGETERFVVKTDVVVELGGLRCVPAVNGAGGEDQSEESGRTSREIILPLRIM